MSDFLSSMTAEMGARRRRLRGMLGGWGQSLAEFLLLGGLVLGSLGLLIGGWMPAAAPWGFAVPFVFVAGFLFLERRRQRALPTAKSYEAVAASYDWAVLLWSLACAVAGAAAFFIAWSARPLPPAEAPGWQPPSSTVSVDLQP